MIRGTGVVAAVGLTLLLLVALAMPAQAHVGWCDHGAHGHGNHRTVQYKRADVDGQHFHYIVSQRRVVGIWWTVWEGRVPC